MSYLASLYSHFLIQLLTMKKIMLLCLGLVAFSALSNAQTCEPDTTVPDTVFVSPFPYNETERPDGGIADTACVGAYYETLITFNIPEIYESPLGPVPITAVEIPVEEGIEGLPASLDYVCNPPNCEFAAETQGCIIIFGDPEAGEEGEYDLTLIATIQTGVLPLTIDVPSDLESGSHYYLHVKEEGFANCVMVDAFEVFASNFSMRNQPNPFSGWTQIIVDAQIGGDFEFAVSDIFGKQLHTEQVRLFEGENVIPFDGSQLASGFYIYSISNGKERLAKKMAVNRN